MKSTGIIRRIDDLGRLVIPKEIRKNLRIKNGENLEIFVSDEETIILKKHNQIDKLKDIATELKDAIYKITKNNVFITNTETIIASNKKNYINQKLSDKIIKIIYKRKEINNLENLELISNKKEKGNYICIPVIASGDLIGSVIVSNQYLTENDLKITKVCADFLARHIEG